MGEEEKDNGKVEYCGASPGTGQLFFLIVPLLPARDDGEADCHDSEHHGGGRARVTGYTEVAVSPSRFETENRFTSKFPHIAKFSH